MAEKYPDGNVRGNVEGMSGGKCPEGNVRIPYITVTFMVNSSG